jgi:hypothetical protein
MLTLAEQQGVAHRWTFGPIRAHAFASVEQPSVVEVAHV